MINYSECDLKKDFRTEIEYNELYLNFQDQEKSFEDDNKMLVFISENKHNKLNKNDIIQSVINLF